jgi:molybdopterin-containing oxidoreductase family membrane subunit
MYWFTKWDMMIFVGTMGFFTLLFFIFIRLMPAISIFEMRTLIPQAKVKES